MTVRIVGSTASPLLDFLATTDVGRWVPPPAEKHAQSEALERKL
jgi:hypothetical protein